MTRGTCFVVLLAVALAGCQGSPPAMPKEEPSSSKPSSAAKDSFPGHDPPALAELLEQAKQKAAPEEAPEPYAPRTVEVPELQPAHTEVLPKSADGKPLVMEQSGAQLEVDETLSDPITAAATCMQLTTSCIQTPDTPDRRDRDSCVYSAATCSNNHPWDEAEPCCPSSCKRLYEKLRKDGYSMRDGWMLVRTSDCFPAMREFMQAARETDEKTAQEQDKP